MYWKGRHQILQHLPLPCWAGMSQGQGQSASSWNHRGRQIYWRGGEKQRKPFPWQRKPLISQFIIRDSCWNCTFSSHQAWPLGSLQHVGTGNEGRKQEVDSAVTRCRRKKQGKAGHSNNYPFCSPHTFNFVGHTNIYEFHFTLATTLANSQAGYYFPLIIDDKQEA